MRISDWSSDVCSSDLISVLLALSQAGQWACRRGTRRCTQQLVVQGCIRGRHGVQAELRGDASAPRGTMLTTQRCVCDIGIQRLSHGVRIAGEYQRTGHTSQIGRAAWRARVCLYWLISVVPAAEHKKQQETD